MDAVAEVKKKITKKRVEIQKDKSDFDGPMGPETTAQTPESAQVMYAGKMCAMLIKQSVASSNMLEGYKRAYDGKITEKEQKELEALHADFEAGFGAAKKRAISIVEASPLWKRLKGIKGFSAYQLGLIMAYVKDISRFETPSRLAVYAGVAPVKGIALTKAHLNRIKEKVFEEDGREFKGFNTHLSQRMFIISETLIRGGGYFYHLYDRLRVRLEERAINEGSCELVGDKYYMKAPYKKYSLIMWSHNNARRRMCRVLLHFVWAEWRALAGLPIRQPYAIDYLKHSGYISLEEVLKADSVKRKNKKRKEKES